MLALQEEELISVFPDPLIATDGSINHPASLPAADAVYASPLADLENKA